MDGVTESDIPPVREFAVCDDSVEEAVRADLQRWGAEIARTGLAALALSGARALDDPELSPTPRSMMMAQVRETLVKLAEIAAEREEPEADEVDEVKARREQRRKQTG